MIIYFADRQFNILGNASTQLHKGLNIVSDLKTESIETGVKIFECTIEFKSEDREAAERYTEPANYLLRSDGDENEFYTIIDATVNAAGHFITLYCEDAGLDMINDVLGAYTATKAMTIAEYINIFAADSGFKIGHNEIADLKRTLSWDGEDTAATRIRSVATQFDNAEISFSFDVKNLEITAKYINIYKKRGEDAGVQLRLNREINNIEIKKSVADLATALYVTGGTPSGKTAPITLAGYAYDDGDYYSPKDSKYLYCRSALAKWSRMNWEGGSGTGHLVKHYTYETTSQSTLCSHAVTKLKELSDVAINYEVDINNADDKQIGLGDTVYIIDDKGELYLSARVLQLETSVTGGSKVITLGDYLIKQAGISDRITALAGQFSNMATVIENNVTNVLHIESSNGLIFKDGIETTQLNVTIYRGSEVISNYEQLTAQLGYTAYLRWSYLSGSEYVEIPSSDSRLSNDSFTLTLSISDITDKLTFKCELVNSSETVAANQVTITKIIDGLNIYVDKVGNIATLTAHIFQGSNEITSLFYDGLFAWYCRSEDTGTDSVLLGYGKSISYDISNIEYGGSTIICEFADTAKWNGLTTYDGSPLCVYSGEQIETLEV